MTRHMLLEFSFRYPLLFSLALYPFPPSFPFSFTMQPSSFLFFFVFGVSTQNSFSLTNQFPSRPSANLYIS